MFRLYFVGGTFGAGKSTLCQTLSPLLPAEHLKASDLVGYTRDPSDPTGKATGKLLSNQERLIVAIEARRMAQGTVLLDGHFCLLDDTYKVVRLPVNVFQRIQPSALVLIEPDPAEVVLRLERRDQGQLDPVLIHQLLHAEREHGQTISEALSVPIMTVDASTAAEDIVTFLQASTQDS